MTVRSKQIITRLQTLGDPEIALHSQRFFKTGKGEYGEGDHFLGIRVPVLRKRAREFSGTPLPDTLALLKSHLHEARLLALLLLVADYTKGSTGEQLDIYDAYLGHTQFINNWDLVDSSAAQIVGAHLFHADRQPLHRLARSHSLWERRISVIATLYFIRRDDFFDTLALAVVLLDDREDLIHKAVGWMLREVGNRDVNAETGFLIKYYRWMPRTMLRYAIEKFPETERQAFLQGTQNGS
ncbi:MAG: DNA alkylation repair protein [Thermoleophilia bacterium]